MKEVGLDDQVFIRSGVYEAKPSSPDGRVTLVGRTECRPDLLGAKGPLCRTIPDQLEPSHANRLDRNPRGSVHMTEHQLIEIGR